MVVFDNSIFCLVLHPDAKPRSQVGRVKDRIDYLMDTLKEQNERIILPAPAFAEFLVLAGSEAPQYVSVIRDNAIFRIEPCDERAAIELADMEISARSKGNKRGSATDSEWQKVKFDRQIVAIAKTHAATRIYSDDPHIANHGADCDIKVIDLAHLAVPPAVQQELGLVRHEDSTKTEATGINERNTEGGENRS
jgi:hypothetical protein